MANFNVIPFGLLGREVSFKDLSFERHLLNFDLQPDYPEDLKQNIVKGVVEYINITFNVEMEMSCEIIIDDIGYCISDIDLETFQVKSRNCN